jgi:senataxin
MPTEMGVQKLDVKTIDGFQGQERDVIIFSAVRSDKKNSSQQLGFVTDKRRTNVGKATQWNSSKLQTQHLSVFESKVVYRENKQRRSRGREVYILKDF